MMAWIAVSSDGRGISERMTDFSDGWVVINELRSGRRDCWGRLASSTPTSTSFSELECGPVLLSLWAPFGVAIVAGVVRARFGAARLGRSGVGLLSIASSLACLLGASASSSS